MVDILHLYSAGHRDFSSANLAGANLWRANLTRDEALKRVADTHGDNHHGSQYAVAINALGDMVEADIKPGRWEDYLLEWTDAK
jgi:hypothetical protein